MQYYLNAAAVCETTSNVTMSLPDPELLTPQAPPVHQEPDSLEPEPKIKRSPRVMLSANSMDSYLDPVDENRTVEEEVTVDVNQTGGGGEWKKSNTAFPRRKVREGRRVEGGVVLYYNEVVASDDSRV